MPTIKEVLHIVDSEGYLAKDDSWVPCTHPDTKDNRDWVQVGHHPSGNLGLGSSHTIDCKSYPEWGDQDNSKPFKKFVLVYYETK